jgi:hypothetical protein
LAENCATTTRVAIMLFRALLSWLAQTFAGYPALFDSQR